MAERYTGETPVQVRERVAVVALAEMQRWPQLAIFHLHKLIVDRPMICGRMVSVTTEFHIHLRAECVQVALHQRLQYAARIYIPISTYFKFPGRSLHGMHFCIHAVRTFAFTPLFFTLLSSLRSFELFLSLQFLIMRDPRFAYRRLVTH